MNSSNFVLDVSESDFEFEVIAFSEKTPVLVDFWASWCVPCKVLSPLLERLAEEAQGGFRLARVNVDENPALAHRYNVRGIPTVLAIKNGQVVSQFTGALPEERVREFIRSIVPTSADLLLEKGRSLTSMHQWRSAEEAYRSYLGQMPENATALLGLAKTLLAQGQAREAYHILRNFPVSREYATAEVLLPLASAMMELQNTGTDEENPLEAAYRHSLRLVGRGNLPAALDGLLDILRQDKHFRNGQVRQVILALLELLGEDDPVTRAYRSELASILFG